MKKYLIVDALRDWVDRRDIKPGDVVIMVSQDKQREYSVWYDHSCKKWKITSSEGIDVMTAEVFEDFYQHTKYKKPLDGCQFFLCK